ncbi:MAG: HD domain-containing protein [Firmicutes bacterium]|nr:HD domain-containing protein [Bacillota bacterium]
MFHDIGKARIPKEILGKSSKLTNKERQVVELHPIYSSDYIKEIEELKELKYIVRAHHERWDGKGYPDKLKKLKYLSWPE